MVPHESHGPIAHLPPLRLDRLGQASDPELAQADGSAAAVVGGEEAVAEILRAADPAIPESLCRAVALGNRRIGHSLE